MGAVDDFVINCVIREGTTVFRAPEKEAVKDGVVDRPVNRDVAVGPVVVDGLF
jgi:hypothetical protein